jgi:pyrophosphatase PpaX
MRHATQTVLRREYTDAELMVNVGGPGLEAQMHALAPDLADELVRVYRAHNEPLHDTLEAFPGIVDVLAQLKDEGRRLGVVTAKRRGTVELAFARLPLAHLFETVVGGDETERHKPHPEPLLLGLERLGAAPAESAYVGDSPYDVEAARAAGMFAVGVTWGLIHDRDRLADADAVVDRPEELLDLL